MALFERVLVPLDGSILAEAVLPHVRKIASRRPIDVVLLRVLPPIPMGEGDLTLVAALDRGEAAGYLDARRASLGFQSRVMIREGRPADAILAVAGEERASLIAMSTHGRTGASRVLFGSVTEEVLRSAPVPLFVSRSFPAEESRSSPRRILVPIESGDLSLHAVGPAIEFASAFDAHIVLLHVISEGPDAADPVHSVREAFDRFRTAGMTVEPVLRRGDAAQEILSVASDQKIDLIAMATHGRTGVSRLVAGSVAEKVTRASKSPLLLVRVPARAAEAKAG